MILENLIFYSIEEKEGPVCILHPALSLLYGVWTIPYSKFEYISGNNQ
jgi:hypothetical protein